MLKTTLLLSLLLLSVCQTTIVKEIDNDTLRGLVNERLEEKGLSSEDNSFGSDCLDIEVFGPGEAYIHCENGGWKK
ncbi:hypothetical protein D6777_04755 [Candidatus Woesearchaeota archaeon]|nr:MAG: hypothetical protein D6777_04755 [Candidatus Woesearchaeota archaeon]